jgi:predicted RNA-binding protein YlqC (UPF0109 family)
VKELVEAIAKALVDNPDQVQVRAIEGEQVTLFELRVHASDLGKVIGRQGRTAQAIRTILSAVGMKLRKRFTLEILEIGSTRGLSGRFTKSLARALQSCGVRGVCPAFSAL